MILTVLFAVIAAILLVSTVSDLLSVGRLAVRERIAQAREPEAPQHGAQVGGEGVRGLHTSSPGLGGWCAHARPSAARTLVRGPE